MIASALSALICGLFLVDNLIFWFPGVVFGFAYAITNFHRPFKIGLYMILSSIIYMGAVQICLRTAGNDLETLWLGGFLAGAFGAFTLALITKFISKTALDFGAEARSTVVGAITGIIFAQLILFSFTQAFSNDENISRLLFPVAFAIWQIPVAWSLTKSSQPSYTVLDGASRNGPS
jgi:hypothetical protein